MMLNKCFHGNKEFTAQNSLIVMRNLKCKVYEDCLLVSELTKDMKDICKMAGIEVPEKMKLQI
jgi:hypothetical protein